MPKSITVIGAQPAFSLIKSIDKADAFVKKRLLEDAGDNGPYGRALGSARHSAHANPFYKALSNVSIFVINSSELSGRPDGKYPEKLYNKETRSCQSGSSIWLKHGPETTPAMLEFRAVHELVHAHDDPAYKKIEFNNLTESMASSPVIPNLKQCFRAAKRNARGKNIASLSLDYARLFVSRLKLLSEISDSAHEQSVVLKIVKEGRARLFSLIYLEGVEPQHANELAAASRDSLLSATLLRLPQSVYDVGLGFMEGLASIVGLEDAMLLTLFSPPAKLGEIASPEEYAAKAKIQPNRPSYPF
ncbi:MAG: hypothetical protein WC506_03365 [Candidatus Micrarchaeia archaeon]